MEWPLGVEAVVAARGVFVSGAVVAFPLAHSASALQVVFCDSSGLFNPQRRRTRPHTCYDARSLCDNALSVRSSDVGGACHWRSVSRGSAGGPFSRVPCA